MRLPCSHTCSAYASWQIISTVILIIKSSIRSTILWIDDADFIETPDGSYFLVEMEQGEREIYVKVTAEGEILP